MDLKTYYQNADLFLLPNSNRRQYKFRLGKDRFFVVRDMIKNVELLRHWLVKFLPLDAYVSRAAYIDPTVVGPKVYKTRAGFNLSNNLFLYCDAVIEIDNTNFENLLNAWEFMKAKGYKDFLFVQTFRGWHYWIFDWRKDIEVLEHPKLRENKFSQEIKKLCNELRMAKISFDENTTKDTRRILRIPESVHSKGVICHTYHKPTQSNPVSLTDLQEMTQIHWLGGGVKSEAVPNSATVISPSSVNFEGAL